MSRYTLVTIEKSGPPQGQSGDNWYCYVIASATSQIVSYRRGTLAETRAVARECVMHLNSQIVGVPSREFVRRAYPVADVEPLPAA
ncbi:MAG: hypothetical protein RI563_04795 [Thiohalophilus sp.]|uniref:hypothetical protein n=1 Tax=Thiohalophilus sp. TaxID=3028392 RepID=UPI0028702693|nr:hypothetical protein [Thiohalophilus sp.]MDR9436170.1 hypothetical protein [Thiohalophilus sp.]